MSTHNICFCGEGISNEYPQHMFFVEKAFLMSIHNICFCGGGISNEYPKCMFLWRNKKNINTSGPSCLKCC